MPTPHHHDRWHRDGSHGGEPYTVVDTAPYRLLLVAACCLSAIAVVRSETADATQSGDVAAVVDAFNAWYTDAQHSHKVVRVAAANVAVQRRGARQRRQLGLRAVSDIHPGDVYLHVNASLTMSVRTWLLGRWPKGCHEGAAGTAVEEAEACATLTRQRLQLRTATLDWIEGHHQNEPAALRADLRTLRQLPVEGHHNHGHKWTTFESIGSARRGTDRDEAVGEEDLASAAVTRILRVLNTDEEDALLALWLLFESVVARQHSFYAPYMAILPATVDELSSILFAQDDKVASLEGTAVYDRIGVYRKKLVVIHTRLNQTFFSKFTFFAVNPTAKQHLSVAGFAARCGGGDRDGGRPCFPNDLASFANFQWAMGVLWSRQVWWEGEAHLAPMHDLANCREPGMNAAGGSNAPPLPSAVHKTELDRSAAAEDSGGDFVRTRATSSAGPGEEVFENYGESNSFYMLFHGFALEHNSKDCGVLTMPDPRQLSTLLPPSTRHRLREGGMLREAPCVRPDNLRFVVVNSATNGGHDDDIEVSTSLDEFLTTLRAGYILTQAPQHAVGRLLAHNLRELRQLADVCAASWGASSCGGDGNGRPPSGAPHRIVQATDLALPHDHDADLDRVLQGATGAVLKAAVAIVGDQLKMVARQAKRLAQRQQGTLRHGRRGNDAAAASGTSWDMITTYVNQQHGFLAYANRTVRQLQALVKRRTPSDGELREDEL